MKMFIFDNPKFIFYGFYSITLEKSFFNIHIFTWYSKETVICNIFKKLIQSGCLLISKI